MKKGLRAKLLAFALALCLCTTMVTPALAANGWRSNSGNRWSISNWWNNRWNHGNDNNTSNSDKSDSSSEPKLTLVEDQSTVAEGTNLRASTYAVDANSSDITADTDTVKYFPVTMYNYNQNTYNTALRNKEASEANKNGTTLDKWKGLYFGPQKSDATDTGSYTTENGTAYAPTTEITSGAYYLVSYNPDVTNKLVSGTGLVALGSGTAGQSIAESALKNGTAWTITKSGNGNDNVYTIKNADGKYLEITGGDIKGVSLSDDAATVNIKPVDSKGTVVISKQITSGRNTTTYYLNAYGGGDTTSLGGYTVGEGDVGSNFYLYHKTNTAVTDALHYEDYNNWTGDLVKGTDDKANGNNTYSGLVNKELDKSQNVQLNETDIGMFRSDDPNNTYGKTIYTRVGLPFQYDKSTNYYTFDSNTMSAHFTASNPAGSGKNMTYSSTPQTISNLDAQGKTNNNNSWLPFNTGSTATTSTADYYFGMQAAIPFSMTANGKMNVNDAKSEDIQFDFSGDDDVWVFVDGKLVLDLGGIHNELAGSMNFAENTWSITKGDGNDTDEDVKTVGDVKSAEMTGKLFNDENGTGVLGTDRTTFAATTSHTLTVFYLERGANASNCKIKFNLPMEDSVSVTKQISDTDSAGAEISKDTWTNLNNHEFTFKLFKDNTPVANANYLIQDESGQTTGNGTTTSDGTFKLKNNQTAKFVGQMLESGNTYYVTEVQEDGWQTPSSTYTATAANGATVVAEADGTTSAKVTMKGSNEANDRLSYIFTNTLTHTDTATVNPQDDRIVIDYGLPVEIDPLANDVAQNAAMSIESVTGEQFGTTDIQGNKIVYTLNKQLTDVEVLTYEVKATATKQGDTDKTAKAKIYIIPATSMYYEENFSDMVKFTGGWAAEGTAGTVYQEPGVVGTLNDSPYGSDNAYMTSAGDSNGTSKYVSTEKEGAKFSYTFTGTGTSFFARTTNNSGYMRVTVYDKNKDKVYTGYRDTSYKTDDDATTLYNIPVFTWNAEEYGTYTVSVSLAKKTGNFGTDFWLDGIRVMNPLNSASTSTNYQTAQDAYAADGESNMTVATLRDALLNDTTEDEDGNLIWNNENFVVFTDSNDKITSASEYQSNGPKEEVYLANGQSVSFSLTNWDSNTNHLYLGIKAPMGSGTVQLGSQSGIEINNTVDCYYDVAKLVTVKEVDGQKVATLKITNSSDKIISLTNIKVTGTPDFVIIPKKDITVSGKDEASE